MVCVRLKFPKKEFLLRVSYMEIYNETVTDLLVDTWKRKPLEVRETINVSELLNSFETQTFGLDLLKWKPGQCYQPVVTPWKNEVI